MKNNTKLSNCLIKLIKWVTFFVVQDSNSIWDYEWFDLSNSFYRKLKVVIKEEKRRRKRLWRRKMEKRKRGKRAMVHYNILKKRTLGERCLGRLGYRYWRPADEPDSVSLSPSLTIQNTQIKSNPTSLTPRISAKNKSTTQLCFP